MILNVISVFIYAVLAAYFAAMMWRIARALERIADKLER